MKNLTHVLIAGCAAMAFTGAFANDTVKKNDTMAKDQMTQGQMTLQQCKDHMATSNKSAKKDDATIRMDAMCAELMNQQEAKKDDAMRKPSTESMQKGDMKKDHMKK